MSTTTSLRQHKAAADMIANAIESLEDDAAVVSYAVNIAGDEELRVASVMAQGELAIPEGCVAVWMTTLCEGVEGTTLALLNRDGFCVSSCEVQ